MATVLMFAIRVALSSRQGDEPPLQANRGGKHCRHFLGHRP